MKKNLLFYIKVQLNLISFKFQIFEMCHTAIPRMHRIGSFKIHSAVKRKGYLPLRVDYFCRGAPHAHRRL